MAEEFVDEEEVFLWNKVCLSRSRQSCVSIAELILKAEIHIRNCVIRLEPEFIESCAGRGYGKKIYRPETLNGKPEVILR